MGWGRVEGIREVGKYLVRGVRLVGGWVIVKEWEECIGGCWGGMRIGDGIGGVM